MCEEGENKSDRGPGVPTLHTQLHGVGAWCTVIFWCWGAVLLFVEDGVRSTLCFMVNGQGSGDVDFLALGEAGAVGSGDYLVW